MRRFWEWATENLTRYTFVVIIPCIVLMWAFAFGVLR